MVQLPFETYGSNTSHPPIFTPRTFSEPHGKSTLRFKIGVLQEVRLMKVESAGGQTYAAAELVRRTVVAMVNLIMTLRGGGNGRLRECGLEARGGSTKKLRNTLC